MIIAKIMDAKVRTKIFGLIAILIVGFAVFGVVAFETLNTVKVNGPVYHAIIENKDLVADILPPPEYLVESYLLVFRMLHEQDPKKLDDLIHRSTKLRAEYETRHQYWVETLAPGELKEAMVVGSYSPARQFLEIRDKQFIPAILSRDHEKALDLARGELKRSYQEHRTFIDKVVTLANQKTLVDEQTAQTTMETRTVIQAVVALCVIATGLLIAYLFSRYIASTVNEYLSFAGKVAQGDLTVRLFPKSNDELGALGVHLNDMARSLAAMTGEIRSSAQDITSATSEILGTVSQHTASANQQSAAVSAAATTIEQARTSAELSAQQAEEVSKLAQASLKVGREGLQAVQVILNGMHDIRTQVQSIIDNIQALSDKTEQIGDITATVNDIADQSSLLAVNAAIEAARSDANGKGFAVVAGEVRVLAEQSKHATNNVRTLLSDIRNATSATMMSSEQGARSVETGLSLAQKAGQVIEELEEGIRSAARSAQQIAVAMHEQRQAMRDIVGSMEGINIATEQFLEGSRLSQHAAQGLNDRARELQSMTERYKIDC